MIKKFSILFCICLGCFFIHPNVVYAAEMSVQNLEKKEESQLFEGQGTLHDPYLINSISDLINLRDAVNSGESFLNKHFLQTTDIDLESIQNWEPIGTEESYFCGKYNGNGYSIINMKSRHTDIAGLFGYSSGIIINVQIKNSDIDAGCVGEVVAFCGFKGYVINCLAENNLTGNLRNEYNSCVIAEVKNTDETISSLNENLEEVLINYGIHCYELRTWIKDESGSIEFGESFGNQYLVNVKRRLSGNGSEKQPYIIRNRNDFVFLREQIFYGKSMSSSYFLQQDDLDFSSVVIWGELAEINYFAGSYDGNGKVIRNMNLSVHNSTANCSSVFGKISGKIFNCIIETERVDQYTNILADSVAASGKVVNCRTLTHKSDLNSAIVGENNGYVANCLFSSENVNLQGIKTQNGEEYNCMSYSSSNQQILLSVLNDSLLEVSFKSGIRADNFCEWNENEAVLGKKWTYQAGKVFDFIFLILKKNIILSFAVMLAIGLGIIQVILLLKEKKKFRINQRAIRQIGIIITVLAFFWDSIILYKRPEMGIKKILFTIVLNVIWFLFIRVNAKAIFEKARKAFSFRTIQKRSLIYVVLCLTFTLGMLNLLIPPLYDSNLYYGQYVNGLNEFSFSLSSFISSFNLWGKQFHFLALILTPFEVLSPGTAYGVYFANILLLTYATWCVYRILETIFPNFKEIHKALLAFCFPVFSYMLSGVTYITPDYYLAIFFVIVVYYYITNRMVLFAFSSMILLGVKRNIIVTYLFFLAIMELRKITSIQKLKKYLFSYRIILLYIPILAALLFYYFAKFNGQSMSIADNSFDEILYTRLLQFGVYGFKWLIILLAFIALVKIIIYKKGNLKEFLKEIIQSDRKLLFLSIIFASFSQLLVYLVTYDVIPITSRYFTQNALAFILLLAAAIYVISEKSLFRTIYCIFFAVILVGQTYITIDPGIMLLASKLEFEKGHIYVQKSGSFGESIGIGDVCANNMEYATWYPLFREMLVGTIENSDIQFYSALDEEHKLVGEDYRFGITYKENYDIFWNTEKGRIEYLPKDENFQISIESISVDSYKQNQGKL